MNELAVTTTKLSPYVKMQSAIARCYSIDECKLIAGEAQAIAAYYKQIKDDETVRKFLQIKIRAWRRIGEIILAAKVDRARCLGKNGEPTMTAYIRRIKETFPDEPAVQNLMDHEFRQAIKIAEVPADFFDANVAEHSNIDGLVYAFSQLQRREWEASPEGKAEIARRRARDREEQARAIKQQAEAAADDKKRQAEDEINSRRLARLYQADDIAMKEVGITLARRDREDMHETVFLLKRSVHEVLRRAAFEKRMTMQAILRAGLLMWFAAHDYDVSAKDMVPTKNER